MFVFWIPATVFVALFVVNATYLIKAINSEARETLGAGETHEALSRETSPT